MGKTYPVRGWWVDSQKENYYTDTLLYESSSLPHKAVSAILQGFP
jgi:hypothetical protein